MKLLGRIYRVNAIAAGLIMFALAAMITVDVFKRWVTNKPITGIYEFSGIMFLALTFLSLGAVQYLGRQIRIDTISGLMKGRVMYLAEAFSELLALVFFGAIMWRTSEAWVSAYRINEVVAGMIEIPYIVYLSIQGYGLLLVCVFLPVSILRNLSKVFSPCEGSRIK